MPSYTTSPEPDAGDEEEEAFTAPSDDEDDDEEEACEARLRDLVSGADRPERERGGT